MEKQGEVAILKTQGLTRRQIMALFMVQGASAGIIGALLGAVLGVVLTIAAFLTHGIVSVAFVASLGFANAMMWPAIFPLGIQGLGRFTEQGSALLIMGIAGGAIVPQLFVLLKESMDFQLVFMLLMVPCYLYILYFAMRGHRVGRG